MAFYTITPYTGSALQDALVKGSHDQDPTIANKNHAQYLDDYLRDRGARTMVVETRYVDRDFLEDFAAYHVRCFVSYENTCSRLHFFSIDINRRQFDAVALRRRLSQDFQKAYLGFIVVKPLPHTVIGRTCLACYPPQGPGFTRSYPTTLSEGANLFGISLSVKSLPFQEQDRDVAACASSALWSVLNGTGQLFQHRTLSPVEITKAAALHTRMDNRDFPAGDGLTSNQIADAIRSVGLEPHAIGVEKPHILRVSALAYLRAGIPCMLLGKLVRNSGQPNEELIGRHAVAIAGFAMPDGSHGAQLPAPARCRFKALSTDKIYCHDDQVGPFSRMIFDPNGLLTSWPNQHGQIFLKPETMIVPLYHKIRISAVSLIERIQVIDGILELFRANGLLPLQERITWDIHLCTLNAFRTELAGSTVDDRNKRRLLFRNYPRFLWRIEAAAAGSSVFEALLDATDLLQGQHMVDVVPHDKAACLAIGAAAASTRVSFANYPQVVRLLDWFTDNQANLQY
jgi:hypothetical protein